MKGDVGVIEGLHITDNADLGDEPIGRVPIWSW